MDFFEKFREALKIPTWWQSEAEGQAAERNLLRFQEFLVESFPAFHQAAERNVLSPYSVVYRLPGSDSGKAAALFLAHYDVVPAETDKWSVDPFGAEIKDGFIYSRGTLDMKGILISIMEAAELLCAEGRKPERDLWFAFGGDEERSGVFGAMTAVKWFEERGQKFDWIMDEGTPVAEKQIKGVDTPVALIGIEEKGFLSLKLTVQQAPGHASQPPEVQAAAILAQALCKISKKPFPFRLSPTVEQFFKQIAPYMSGIQRFVMSHARALGPLFFKLAATAPAIASMLRTTVAMTMLEGSAADNVLPSQVNAVINLRLLWPWTVETATAFIKKAINDERVKISTHGPGSDPVPPSPDYTKSGWREIQAALESSMPGIPMIPFIMIATTDSRHYQKLSDRIFRFTPYLLDPKEMGGIHGHDERIGVENLRRGLNFYSLLMRSL